MQYRDYIDGLRAIAVLSVVFFHAAPDMLPGGFVGVDVFFVISGFLITYIIASEIRNGTFTIAGFYLRRIRRLLPAAFVVYMFTFAAAAILLFPDAFREFGKSLIAATLIYANVHFAKRSGYFDAPSHEKPLLHTWSLSIEEQFYIVWPIFLLLFLPRIRSHWLMLLVTVTLLASLGYAEWAARKASATAFFDVFARIWELLTGAALALTIHHIRLNAALRESFAWLGLTLILASCVLLNEAVTFPGISALPACLGAAMVIASSFHQTTTASRLLSLSPIVFIGLISYSLYLWHWPVLTLARYYLERPLSVNEAFPLVLFAFIAAVLSWRYIERPFREGKAKIHWPSATIVKASAVCFISLLVVGLAVDKGNGWSWRYDETEKQLFEQMNSRNPYRSDCFGSEKSFSNDDICNFGKAKTKSQSYDIAIFGDSNADHFVPTFARQTKNAGLSGRQVTHSDCAALFGVRVKSRKRSKHKQCRNYQKTVIAFLEANPNLELAILGANWGAYEEQLTDNRLEDILPNNSEVAALYKPPQKTELEANLRATVEVFEQRGVKVLLVGRIPYQKKKHHLPVRCVVNAFRENKNSEFCGIETQSALADLSKSNQILQRIAADFENVTAVLPSDMMCNDKVCSVVRDGMFLYRDFKHLSGAGAHYLAKHIKLPELN